MAYTTKAAEYLCGGVATNGENVDDFFAFFSTFKDGTKKARYEI